MANWSLAGRAASAPMRVVWERIRIFLGSPSDDELLLAAVFAGCVFGVTWVPRLAEAVATAHGLGENQGDGSDP